MRFSEVQKSYSTQPHRQIVVVEKHPAPAVGASAARAVLGGGGGSGGAALHRLRRGRKHGGLDAHARQNVLCVFGGGSGCRGNAQALPDPSGMDAWNVTKFMKEMYEDFLNGFENPGKIDRFQQRFQVKTFWTTDG